MMMSTVFKRFILILSCVALVLGGAPMRAEGARAVDSRPVHVYFFTGGPVDVFSRETAKNIRTKLETYSRDLCVASKFERHWFTHWRGVAKDIANSKGRDKIVLIGHSWGAAGAVQVAHHLNKKQVPIDLLVTIDTVPVPGLIGHARIPENVQSNYNFYQASDLFAHTAHKNHRKNDKSETGIHNIQVLMGAVYSPHMRIDDRIEPIISSMVRMLMQGYLNNIRLPDKLDKQLICEATKELENYSK